MESRSGMAQLEIARKNMDRKVDSKAHQHRRKRDREDIQMPDDSRCVTERPRHAHRQHQESQKRMQKSSKPKEHQQGDPHE